jgi:hypothetical protein
MTIKDYLRNLKFNPQDRNFAAASRWLTSLKEAIHIKDAKQVVQMCGLEEKNINTFSKYT